MGVLVAGATAASGTAIVGELLRAGYEVTATWNSEPGRDRLERELGGSVRLAGADLSRPGGGVEHAVASVDDLEGVVSLVGSFSSGPKVHETHPDDFARIVQLNAAPVFLLAHAAMPRLVERGGGAFVAFSARAALRPFAGGAGYSVAKAAVLALVKALDADYGKDGVRCNAILPGTIDTAANREVRPNADRSSWVAPEQLAKLVRFLVSNESAPLSGAALPV